MNTGGRLTPFLYSLQGPIPYNSIAHIQGGSSHFIRPLWKHLHRPDQMYVFQTLTSLTITIMPYQFDMQAHYFKITTLNP